MRSLPIGFSRVRGASTVPAKIARVHRLKPATSQISPAQEPVMADLKSTFEKAVADSKNLSEKPDNATLLQLYALYKQGTAGDVDGKRPGFTDMVGRAKWDAWNEIKGKDANAAMSEYVALIESLK
jgi:diazepam-binding inhibitor (GABA receptor modulator, acyl-CoA-binding protein)